MKNIFISIIITTYNWPAALNRALSSLYNQSYTDYEILVADDGSNEATTAVIAKFKSKHIPIHHIWHEDKGFRAAMIRNKAVAKAKGDYLVFIDGDCFVEYRFVEMQARLAQKNRFVAGNRILLKPALSEQILNQNLAAETWSILTWFKIRSRSQINRWLSLIRLPLGPLRNVFKYSWKGVKTCNLAVWRDAFILVNGFDEKFEGWGFEDSDLVIRLLRAGIYRKSGKNALAVFHLWHRETDRQYVLSNQTFLEHTKKSRAIRAVQGLNQYLS